MTEQEYIDITDLAKLRIAKNILYDCMNDKAKKVNIIVAMLVTELEEKTRDIITE